MKKKLLIISGWAHSIKSIQPMGDRLSKKFDTTLISGTDALAMERLPENDFILTGSMGGLIAIERLPQCCKKLVLLSATACFCKRADYMHGTDSRVIKRMVRRLDKDPKTLIDKFFMNVHSPQKPSRQKKENAELDINGLKDGLYYLKETDLRKLIPRIEIPILIMHGKDDKIIPIGAAEWLDENLQKSELIIYEGMGHALAAHDFESTMKAAENFLA